jgi:uncharacterized membrane protein
MKPIVRSIILSLVILSVFSINIITLTYAEAEEKGNLHGTVVDEYGIPLDDVKISIYSSSGDVDIEYTDEGGYFRFALSGWFTLVFTKDGYATVTREVNVPQELWEDPKSDPVKMGEIILYPALKLETTYLVISEEQGNEINLPLTITNSGETDEIIDLEGFVPDGWSISFFTASNLAVERLYLASEHSEALTIEIVPTEDAPIGDYNIVVNASSKDPLLKASLDLEVKLRESSQNVEIISSFTDITAEAGESFKFPLSIWNKGNRDALLLLTVASAPENWEIVFLSDDIEVSSLFVEEDESIGIQLEVTPPSIVKTGEYPIVIHIESDDGIISETINLKSTISGSYELGLKLSTLYSTVKIGDSVTFTAYVSNNGQSPVTGLYLDAEYPGEWDISIIPVQVDSLSPKETYSFDITVETPSNTVAGDYLITLTASSDQAESEDSQIRLTAQASTSWGFIGLGVAAIFVLVPILVFMRFKRR